MTKFAMLRHAPTEWNRAGKLQGRTDIPLSDAGRAEASSWRLPRGYEDWTWLASPLRRTRETASILFAGDATIDDRLIETDWGEWEGSDLEELRRDWGDGIARDGQAGLDFSAPNGESPRGVQQRLTPLLLKIGQSESNTIAITHKGVIRAAYALATGWDMMAKPREKLANKLHVFNIDAQGRLSVDKLNIPLTG